jgi:ATP phosphoribosyltransferase regulatory subunit HisZ
MSGRSIHRSALASALALVAYAALASPPSADAAGERPFLAGNRRAMDRMMQGMAAKPTGDVDADFAAMMIPHHQGAIDMAVLELRYGRNEQLRRIAQEIIVDQQQEIAAMRLALGQPLPPSSPAPTQPAATPATPPAPTPPP